MDGPIDDYYGGVTDFQKRDTPGPVVESVFARIEKRISNMNLFIMHYFYLKLCAMFYSLSSCSLTNSAIQIKFPKISQSIYYLA